MDDILEDLLAGRTSVAEAKRKIRNSMIEIEDFAKFDVNRETRVGVPEVILCTGKTAGQVFEIVKSALRENGRVILSKVPANTFDEVDFPDHDVMRYPDAGMMVVGRKDERDCREERKRPTIGIMTAGTADIPVATEAMVLAEEMGCDVYHSYDVGVAGIHRLWPALKEMNRRDIRVIIVAAGREGALSSVVAGLSEAVVIGLPVSSGYGYGGGGKAALMGMLQSCAPILVVNVDAGVVAGMMGAKIAKMIHRTEKAGTN